MLVCMQEAGLANLHLERLGRFLVGLCLLALPGSRVGQAIVNDHRTPRFLPCLPAPASA
jgi:hypothetical protein